MKIAILSALPLDPPRGGAEIVAARMAQVLRDAGHAVTVVTHDPIDQSMGSERPDWVITHNVRGLGWLLPRRIRRIELKQVHVLHDIQLIEPSGIVYGNLRSTLMRRVWSALMRWIWGSPEVVIGPSQWILDVHRQWGFFSKSKLVHLPNPSSVTPPLEKGEKEGVRRLLFVGQIERHKGVFDLLAAARSLPSSVRVEFIGTGAALDELKRAATDDPRFLFRGRLAPDDIPAVLVGAIAVVVPSRCLENAPLTITDALAAGIPVIATRVGGISELVRDGENGLLVPPSDVAALARAMQSVLDVPLKPPPSAGMSIREYGERIISIVSHIGVRP